MRKFFILTVGVGLIALVSWLASFVVPRTCAVPADLTAKAEHIIQIRGLLDAQSDAWNAGDLEGFMANYHTSEQLRFAAGGDVLNGWAAVLARYQERYPDKAAMGYLSLTQREIEVLSATDAVAFGRWTLMTETESSMGLFTLQMKSIDGAWVIVNHHSSTG